MRRWGRIRAADIGVEGIVREGTSRAAFGVIVGNRGFFPDHLAKSGRKDMLDAIKAAGAKAVALGPGDTKHGAVETREDAVKCAALFKAHRDEIEGVIVTLPNFG